MYSIGFIAVEADLSHIIFWCNLNKKEQNLSVITNTLLEIEIVNFTSSISHILHHQKCPYHSIFEYSVYFSYILVIPDYGTSRTAVRLQTAAFQKFHKKLIYLNRHWYARQRQYCTNMFVTSQFVTSDYFIWSYRKSYSEKLLFLFLIN